MAESVPFYDKYDGLDRKAKSKNRYQSRDLVREEQKVRCKKITNILKKKESQRTQEEVLMLETWPDIVKLVQKRAQVLAKKKQRTLEVEDDPDILSAKCQQLANAIKTSKKVVVYTGAGISTAASIPDYRGPNGVWTMLKQGRELEAQDLSDAEPTFTHMSITKLYTEGYVKYVVSQNCDGLHIRSSLPRNIISEVHGNMYIEVCPNCKPQQEYVRLFDVTEKTGVRRHKTGRKCHRCSSALKDTVVHFGEKGGMRSPYWWKRAVKAANTADLILCLGSSLKVLKKYACLWCMDKKVQQRPKLFIVNLQWTPKDDNATLKINGRCDDVMLQVMNYLSLEVDPYQRIMDPIFKMSVPLKKHEQKTTSNKILQVPNGYAQNVRVNRNHTDKYKQETVSGDKSCVKKKTPSDEPFSVIKTLLNSPVPQEENGRTRESIKLLTGVISTTDRVKKDFKTNGIHISNCPPGSTLFPCGLGSFQPAFLVMRPVHDAKLAGNFQLQVDIPKQTNSVKVNLGDKNKDHICNRDCVNDKDSLKDENDEGRCDDALQEHALDLSTARNSVTNGSSFSSNHIQDVQRMSVTQDAKTAEYSDNTNEDKCNCAPVLPQTVISAHSLSSSNTHPGDSENPGSSCSVDDIQVETTGEATEDKPAVLQAKKRTSVPGWFGKGLTIRKKRKFYV